jgi:hypothetical protein
MNKTIKVWIAINKNGKLTLHGEYPVRDEKNGKWTSKYPFINSILYKELSNMISKSSLTWESDPEYMETNL